MKNGSTITDSGENENKGPTKFARVLFENSIPLKEIEDNTSISYPVLIDLKNGNRENYHDRTLLDIVTYINKAYNLTLKPEDIQE